jgi:anti-anti-sigma factor
MQLRLASQESNLARVTSSSPITQQTLGGQTEHFRELLGADAYSRQVLWDLSASDYIDSSGVGMLVSSHKKFKDAGGILVFHSIGALAMKVLKMLRMDLLLHLAASEAGAAEMAQKDRA